MKIDQRQVDLLKKIVKVLDPFFRVTLQLSRDDACISEVNLDTLYCFLVTIHQVVPIVTQLKEDLAEVSDDDQGIKGFKRKLLAGVEERMGKLEEQEKYSLSSSLDRGQKLV